MEATESDSSFQRETWGIKVPVRVSLASTEVTTPEGPLPLLLMLPRYSYLHFKAEEALSFFRRVLIDQSSYTAYFAIDGMPLPWHMPLGVLYDLFCGEGSLWSLTVHFPIRMPVSLLPWRKGENDEATKPVRRMFLSLLKEACFIFYGSNGKIFLKGQQCLDVWQGVSEGDFSKFRGAFDLFELQPKIRPNAKPRVPVKIFYKKNGSSRVWREKIKTLSRPIEVDPDGSTPTLKNVLQNVLPELNLGSTTGSTDCTADGETNEGGDNGVLQGTESYASALSNTEAVPDSNDTTNDIQVLICGIEPPLDCPLAWLHRHLCAPDFFLYVVVKHRWKVQT